MAWIPAEGSEFQESDLLPICLSTCLVRTAPAATKCGHEPLHFCTVCVSKLEA